MLCANLAEAPLRTRPGKLPQKLLVAQLARIGTRSSGWQIGKRHYRINLGDVLEAHEQALDAFGGRRGISNFDSIQGAIGRPYHGYHLRIHSKAAALLHGLATSHGFTDGNKRTAWLTTIVLIENSGFEFELLEEDRIDDVVVDVVTGSMSQADLENWFRKRIT